MVEEYSLPPDGLRSGLHRLYHDKTLCDGQLSAGGKVFDIHRNVLAAVSPYFEAMFTRGFKESDKNVIELEVM